ncbi:winged helix-turn-helix transcriptional regulator [Pelagibacterales bacterium SAG-MED16]|jgi:DNA-binding MarR family transcriptional regulator|nr:winged helix-turn-helix transcriptional regulator [Pelagibacterales bacterium SAG-MED16]|tara:strand:+ start:97 stop:453 length:357 start_codon:yes stop_codon:yes gene_type:complete
MEKIFSNLYKDLIKNISINGNPHEKFLFKSRSHLIIIFCIASNQSVTLEQLCEKIPYKIISRSTIQSILKEGVANNFLKKEIDENDKRQKNYKLSDTSKGMLKNWLENQKKLIDSKVA